MKPIFPKIEVFVCLDGEWQIRDVSDLFKQWQAATLKEMKKKFKKEAKE